MEKSIVEKLKTINEYNGVGSNLYRGGEIIMFLGYRFLQDAVACGRLTKVKDASEGAGIYRLTQ